MDKARIRLIFRKEGMVAILMNTNQVNYKKIIDLGYGIQGSGKGYTWICRIQPPHIKFHKINNGY